MKTMLFLLIVVAISAVYGQNPTIKIEPSTTVVEATLQKKLDLICKVENKPAGSKVRWDIILSRNPDNTIRRAVQLSEGSTVEDESRHSIKVEDSDQTYILTILSVKLEDEAEYMCKVAISGTNWVSQSALVEVVEKPVINPHLTTPDTEIQSGESLELRCNASGRPSPQISWSRAGNAVLPGGGVTRMSSILTIASVQPVHRGKYICKAMNSKGAHTWQMSLTVKFSPVIEVEQARVEQAVGYKQYLVCRIEANPPPDTIQWSHGTDAITDSYKHYKVTNIEGADFTRTSKLTIDGVKESDYGEFTCRAQNELGSFDRTMELGRASVPVLDRTGEARQGGASSLFVSMISIMLCTIASIVIGG